MKGKVEAKHENRHGKYVTVLVEDPLDKLSQRLNVPGEYPLGTEIELVIRVVEQL